METTPQRTKLSIRKLKDGRTPDFSLEQSSIFIIF